MAVFPNSHKEYRGVMNAFWIEPAKRDVMGYRLTNVDPGTAIYPGTPIKTDEAAKTAVVCKHAVVVAVAADKKTLTVKEGHLMTSASKVAISGASPLVQLNIASVSGDNIIVLSAQNNSIKEGDVLVEVATTGEGQEAVVAPVALPNRVVCALAEIDELDKTCSAAHEGIVLQNVVHYPKEYLNDTTYPGYISLVGNPKLEFIIQ
jgi:hypothetical protein